ncbi:hypothetical protein [Rhizobium tubonense]|uniref:Uncharacterized protein n=1 Tax=Rhizobium tubonense TaxID=484088 RepID=A0A2W4C846_9HYPH|nr:hypothetical protein [Rhizobium tubonense]PZM07578.1 hypothetical protein CPY51_31090 [Rhizobium tubonense]
MIKISTPDGDVELTGQEEADYLASLPPIAAPTITSVSARQFKLQLLAAGLLDEVEAWTGTQSRAVQIAFEYSGSFVRDEPMMIAGFKAMGFADPQIDAFFEAAKKL